ncbi:VOC family protein [Streptomyces sp. YU58]|uniref:VOC family protein n=1 Tax=Streptomyces sp. SX92 TaxID=3158972 RepID=UPI0032C227C7
MGDHPRLARQPHRPDQPLHRGTQRTGPVVPDLSVEVEDVDTVYAQVVASGAEVVRELRDEEWGVRRFFVRDPNGRVVNVLTHRPR